jgi:lysophospholipase L1-like esterase
VRPELRLWLWGGIALGGLAIAVSSNSSSVPARRPGRGPSPPLPPPRIATGARLLLIGDSLAQALQAPMGQLAKDAGVVFLADGRQNTVISQWAAQPWLTTDLQSFKPTSVLISLGTNDMKMSNPAAEQPQVVQILRTLATAKTDVLWVGPPTMPFPDKGVRAMIASTGVAVYPSETLTIARAADGIHPTILGAAGWAAAIWRAL